MDDLVNHAEVTRLASAPVPVQGMQMQLTVFGRRAGDGTEIEDVVALRTPPCAGLARTAPLVRVHSACFTGDVLGSAKCDCGPQLETALGKIVRSGDGAVLYMLRQEGRGIGLANKIRAYALQAIGHDTMSANIALGLPVEGRDFRIAAACLDQLGLRRIRLLTNNPLKIAGLTKHGIDVERRVPLSGFITSHNVEYLRTKDRAMGHLGSRA